MLDECLLPSLSVMRGNAPAGDALYNVLTLLPYTTRYRYVFVCVFIVFWFDCVFDTCALDGFWMIFIFSTIFISQIICAMD
jgi:hypothetical protein